MSEYCNAVAAATENRCSENIRQVIVEGLDFARSPPEYGATENSFVGSLAGTRDNGSVLGCARSILRWRRIICSLIPSRYLF